MIYGPFMVHETLKTEEGKRGVYLNQSQVFINFLLQCSFPLLESETEKKCRASRLWVFLIGWGSL